MSAKVNLGVTLGSLTLLVIIGVVVITGSKANEEAAILAKINSEAAKVHSIENSKQIKKVNQTLTEFVERWGERIKIGNTNTNATQNYLKNITEISYEQEQQILDLARNQSLILQEQIENERHIIGTEKNIIGNLTDHRLVANATRDELKDFIRDRNSAFNDTLDKLDNITAQNRELIIAFNATNEEERGKAVNNIIEQLHADHEIIMEGLNISSTDNKTEASSSIDQLKKAIEALEKKQGFVPPGLAKK